MAQCDLRTDQQPGRGRDVPRTQRLGLAARLGWAGLVSIAGCGPVVDADSAASAAGTTATAPPPSDSGSDTTIAVPTTCAVRGSQDCVCPGDRTGSQVCLPGGEFGTCSCIDPTGTGEPPTSDSTEATGDSMDTTGSSTGDPTPITCPQTPVPCTGVIAVETNPGLFDVSMCTSLDGSLRLSGSVSDITSLGCLSTMGTLSIESTELTDLSGLSRLQQLGTLEIHAASELTRIGLSQLGTLERLSLTGNPALEQLDFPDLTEVSSTVEITENPRLPHCEVEDIL